LLSDRANSAEVRLLGIGDHIIERFRSTIRSIRHDQRKEENRAFRGSAIFALLSVTALFYVFSLVVESTLRQEASMGDLVVFAAAMIRLRKTMERFTLVLSICVEQLGYVKYLRSFLEREPSRKKAVFDTLQDFKGTVEIEGLSFRYPGTETLVLDNLSLSIAAGETVAFVGENGCGKSTLVKLIAGFYPEYEGSITLSERDLHCLKPADLRRNISFVFQDFACYSATVAENIAYGDWPRLQNDRKGIEKLALSLNLDAKIREMPDGYDTMLGRTFGDYEPSGGIWQRIAIARAFASGAPLLILDEPTASVDVRTEYELFAQLDKLARDRTTILISHRFSTVSMADRIFVMRGGRIVEQGSHEQLISMDDYYAELYRYFMMRMRIDG
jgi:ATP-binding cassette subfamily B protein